jgi:hypothetical protein
LERGDRKIANSNKLKRILDGLEDGGYGKFRAIRAEIFATKFREGQRPKVTCIEEGISYHYSTDPTESMTDSVDSVLYIIVEAEARSWCESN